MNLAVMYLLFYWPFAVPLWLAVFGLVYLAVRRWRPGPHSRRRAALFALVFWLSAGLSADLILALLSFREGPLCAFTLASDCAPMEGFFLGLGPLIELWPLFLFTNLLTGIYAVERAVVGLAAILLGLVAAATYARRKVQEKNPAR